jgi:amidase
VGDELVALTAVEAVAALARGDVTPAELVEAAAARMDVVEPWVNALPTPCVDRALDHARRLGALPPDERGPLGGLPIAVKDLTDVAGVRTTRGSLLHADRVPARSDIVVERLEGRGAIVVAKSNTPELGAGSHTFNEVFGATRNPWAVDRSAGGSSGGSAAALATGEVWLATGTDLGGSLRNPASFCGVVGFRPSPGTVASGPRALPFGDLGVDGPLGRTVGDAALLLDAMAGTHPADPLARAAPPLPFATAAARPALPARVAFSTDLGVTAVEPEVADVCRAAAAWFAAQGCEVVEAHPDLSGGVEAFHVLRALAYATADADLLAQRDRVKEEVIWNIEAGLALDVRDVIGAQRTRGALAGAVAAFFESHDLLVCPAAVLPPFPIGWRWPREVAGVRHDDYLGWLAICSVLSLTSCPVLALPAGTTSDGLPVGIQLVAPWRAEHRLLAAGAAFEADHPFAGLLPVDPRPQEARA